jgi:[ribosomal protein S18]-alanine N-acetyltransferase
VFGWFRKSGNQSRSLSVRFVRSSDSTRLANLHAQGFDRAWGESEFEALIADASVIGHVICQGGREAVGFILSRKAADEAEILSIVIDRKERGRGTGRLLLTQHMGFLMQERIRKLFLEVEAENAAAIRLYRGSGFTDIGRRKSYYRKADGTSADALTMERKI